MKKLLTTITLSTLLGTSTSSLKPVFTSNVVNHGFKSNKINNKDISITNENDTNPFDFAKINQISNIKDIVFSVNGETMFVSTSDGVYKSTDDGINFSIIKGIPNITVTKLITDKKNNVFASDREGNVYKSNGTDEFTKINTFNNIGGLGWTLAINNKNNDIYSGIYRGLYKTNPINLLLNVNKPDTFDKSWPLYKGIVYNSAQKIDIKNNLIASATLDGKSITIPTTDLDIPSGEHNLILTLKDKTLASVFGGDPNTGQVTYKLWVKTLIDKNQIDYQTKIDDTQLYSGLVSNAGNTNMKDIIQTKIKDGTGTHDASLNIDFKDILIDFDVNKSFYEQGTVDETTNDFKATGSKLGVSKNLSIKINGTYWNGNPF